MYPEKIKEYCKEQQFTNHKKMLKDLRVYYRCHGESSKSMLFKIDKEEKMLDEYYQKWKKEQQQTVTS